ncbi:hypothetical protein D0Z08_28510 [Nocardioides immobilis]|uniref:FAD-binding FR-type domain-containing protein n=1 Tax=Nocardioides immobilis TaxID=2049295 RepID=A0A417XT71_9ACTN|nr:FAD-binding oxidoreductase [Nocardioides immobilis]RHW23659.1 hypothetical protein D0Z08_28510 [Nocardioides immobilis]
MSEFAVVTYERVESVAVIRFNRTAYANAQNSPMTHVLDDAIARAVNDGEVGSGRPPPGARAETSGGLRTSARRNAMSTGHSRDERFCARCMRLRSSRHAHARQFLTVRVPSEHGGTVARSYSFSSAPGVDSAPRITVKRIAGGYASNWLCDNLVPGARLQSLAPGGTFTPSDLNASLLLVAAGSGITPVMSILKASLAEGSAKRGAHLCQSR